ncbi:MAG: cupin domain-containing protein [Blastocatellia bacterium]|nr:cupin domain-containing protein [Blastocatellia bacterium]MBN8723783.1 cupin domain-containing protein [Acidobacteriota bacterium]
MSIINNLEVEEFSLPGLVHKTICGPAFGVNNFEVWLQTISPKAETPVHKHDCDEMILVLKGNGTFILEDKTSYFGPNSTLVIPPNAVHQIINSGDEEMQLVATLSVPNVQVLTSNNQPIPLPWQN